MTLRARLAWGLFAITLVLIVPLLLSLKSLEHLYETLAGGTVALAT